MVGIATDIIENMNLSTVVMECNLVGNTKERWVDTGATKHVCTNRWMFSSHTPTKQDEQLYMGNSSTLKVEGVEKVALKYLKV